MSVEDAASAGIEQIEQAVEDGTVEELIAEYPDCEETIRLFAEGY